MYLCLTVECITFGLHSFVFHFGKYIDPPMNFSILTPLPPPPPVPSPFF